MTIDLEVTDWVEWTGGENPVPGAIVDLRYGRGDEYFGRDADMTNWKPTGHHDGASDIIAYRVVSPTPASAAKGDEPFAYIGWDIVCDWRREPDTHGRRLYLWREPEHGRVPLFLDQPHPSQQAGTEGLSQVRDDMETMAHDLHTLAVSTRFDQETRTLFQKASENVLTLRAALNTSEAR